MDDTKIFLLVLTFLFHGLILVRLAMLIKEINKKEKMYDN